MVWKEWLVFFVGFGVVAPELPSYLKLCKKHELANCGVASGQEAVLRLWKGDPQMNLPIVDPLKITRIPLVDDGSRQFHLKLNFTNVDLYGLKNTRVLSVALNESLRQFTTVIALPKLVFKADYSGSGRVLVLPIFGTGPCQLDIESPVLTFRVDYDLKRKNGQEIAQITHIGNSIQMKRMRIQLKNLFNGNKVLGDNMNKVLNENWEALGDQFGSAIVSAIVNELRPFFDAICQTPFNRIFL